MNSSLIREQLQTEYPGKFVVENEIDGIVTEILCEVEPTSEHPTFSRAIAVIDRSLPHYHVRLTETYRVMKGNLTLHVGSDTFHLQAGDSYTIKPNTTHWAVGDETWVEVVSTPGWDKEDHIVE